MTTGGSNDSVSRIREVFLQAREMPEGPEREAYLEEACRSDPNLRENVSQMLAKESASETFLEDTPDRRTVVAGQESLIGTVIGRYRIVEQLGEGGFGEVFRVEQTEPVRRELALKIIKPGMDSREVIARFERERQALALMDHPNIAQVYDAGTTETGRPYFVMELACGHRITAYSDRKKLSISDRLALFRQICAAVQHAHQKGIIHRDLKPSNIVITTDPTTGAAIPKIIDFGIAKSLKGPLTEETLVTQREVLLGTPAYMSPEQLELGSDNVDTRTDIYALGVLLYELLAGVQPFERETLERAAFAEVRRIIREVEPPKPSDRVRTMGSTRGSVAQTRLTAPPTLERILRGDLDWIVMKAIEKDRDRRYQGAGEFADDIARYLGNRPVEAGPPGRAYRLKKFVRRHRVGVVFTGALAATVVSGLILALIGFTRASRERNRAEVAEILAETDSVRLMAAHSVLAPYLWHDPNALPDFLLLKSGEESVPSSRVLGEALNRLVTRLEAPPPGLEEVERDIRKALADSFLCLELTTDALTQLDRIIDLDLAEFGSDDVRYADSLMEKAHALTTGFKGVVEFSHGYSRPRPTPDWQKTEATRLRTQAAAIYRRNNYLSPESIAAMGRTGYGDPENWEARSREIVDLHTRYYGEGSIRTLDSLFGLGMGLAWRGRLDEAEPFLEKYRAAVEAFDDGPYSIPHSAAPSLGSVYERNNQYDKAETIYREEIARLEGKVRGEFLTDYGGVLRRLNRLLEAQGRPEPEIGAKLARINLWRALDPALCRADYRLNVRTAGTYRLYLRWDGFDIGSNEICARIRELQDGEGGSISDVYGFVIPDAFPGDADFATVNEWQDRALRETIGPRLRTAFSWPAEWEISEPGTYTLQLIGTNTGAAVDALVLQLASLPRPIGDGPARTPRNTDGSYDETDGGIAVEAEYPTTCLPGRITEWLAVPAEAEAIVEFENYTGEGYLQVLPEGDPSDPVEIIRNRAFAAEQVGQDKRALDLYTEALDRSPSYDSYFLRGLAHERLGDYEKALADFQRAIDLDPDLDKVYPHFWDCQLRLGNNDYLIETVQPYLSLNPWLHAKLARARANKGLWREAIEGIPSKTADDKMRILRGDLYAENGDYSNAEKEFLKAAEMDRRSYEPYGRLAALYLLNGNRKAYELCLRDLPELRDMDRNSHRLYLWLSSLGPDTCPERETLKEFVERFLDLFEPTNVDDRLIHAELAGAALYRAGQFDRAVELLSAAQEIEAEPWGTYRCRWMFFLAMALNEQGRMEEARSWFEKADACLIEERVSVPANRDLAYPTPWDDTVTVELLREEAAAMLGIRTETGHTVMLD
jgi:serine/threonine protein kinase/tetratricopeptide (TPR) repeat protein